MTCGFSYMSSSRYGRKSNNAQCIQPSVLPFARVRSHGILTMCPSVAAFAITLGPTNPQLIVSAAETSIFRRVGFSPTLWLLVPAFSLPNAPPWVTPLASLRIGTLSYRSVLTNQNRTLSVGTMLSPDYLRRRNSR